MSEPFDPYREALVVETTTLWSPEARATVSGWEPARRQRFERQLHAAAAEAAELNYVRVHTGFCRQITVQTADLDRLQASLSGGA
jgi:hypothetical protein